jgi:hypothetical protein
MRVISKRSCVEVNFSFFESKSVTSGWKQFKKRGIPTIMPIWFLKPPHKILESVIIEEKEMRG